ncbi:MAG: adenylosuccinate lyase [Acidiferrobacterales bacterium]|nr:adenylosuccinate lyase [Acidiferrobacterales bacterium]
MTDTDYSPAICALSPLDGRYHHKVEPLREIFSELGLIRYRLHVEVEWLIALGSLEPVAELNEFTPQTISHLRSLVNDFSVDEGHEVKAIERKTNHDVKALEYYMKDSLSDMPALAGSLEFIHFGCTSYDINDNCFGLMLTDARNQVLVPAVENLISLISDMATSLADVPMLSRTHGQPASPTTVGKELRVFAHRLEGQNRSFAEIPINGKLSGAVGNFNSLHAAYPEIDWPSVAREFVESLGLTYNPITTQTEAHDYIAEYSHCLHRINSILLDLCRDIWGYISIGYFSQKTIASEVGSSAMPHKVNPIDFENAEGNLGIANAIFDHLADKLPVSRWQRDLSDSTVLRNLGVPIGHSLIAYQSIAAGLGKLTVNQSRISEDLDRSWEVLSEAVQTVLRKHGGELPYEKLKELTRGVAISAAQIESFISELDLPDEEKRRLSELTPADYRGIAEQLAKTTPSG